MYTGYNVSLSRNLQYVNDSIVKSCHHTTKPMSIAEHDNLSIARHHRTRQSRRVRQTPESDHL